MDDAIAQVVMVTNTTPEKAAQYLTLADGDADQAVTLFFENGGADLVVSSSSAAPHVPTSGPERAAGRGGFRDPIDLDADEDISDDNDPQITGFRKSGNSREGGPSYGQTSSFDDDAALARQLQEEMYGGPPGLGSREEDAIRAPIARQSETLVGPGADMGVLPDADIPAAVQRRMQEMQRRRGAGRAGIFNQHHATSSIWTNEEGVDERDLLAEATGGASEASSKSSMLARMFQPPWDLMYKGPWDQAREEGREEKKWLLVNIQDGSVFDCQVLNRDLWKNPSVVDTVRENFLFLQYSRDDVRAEQYLQYYFQEYQNLDRYPHIAIVDPRTGEQVKVWSREVPKAADFLMQLHEFLDRYSLSNNARNPVAKRKPEPKKEKDVHQMTEEEMMELAMQASLDNQSKTTASNAYDPDDLTRSIGDLAGNDLMKAKENDQEGDAMSYFKNGNESSMANVPSPFALIASDRPHTEPAQGPDITRIQFRHPAGRVIRRFALSDPVRRLYEWLKAEPLEGKQGAEFELISMGKNLIESAETTVEQAGLKNGTVMIEFLED